MLTVGSCRERQAPSSCECVLLLPYLSAAAVRWLHRNGESCSDSQEVRCPDAGLVSGHLQKTADECYIRVPGW